MSQVEDIIMNITSRLQKKSIAAVMAVGYFLQRAFPTKIVGKHARLLFSASGFDAGNWQTFRANAQSIRQNHRALLFCSSRTLPRHL